MIDKLTPQEIRTCSVCDEEKPLIAFRKAARNVSGHAFVCLACHREQSARYYAENKDAVYEYQRGRNYRAKYGISVEEYNQMFADQSGRCAICNRHQSEFDRRFAVDHVHDTKAVRGLLCNRCNLGVSKFEDNVGLLRNAIRYLEQFREEV